MDSSQRTTVPVVTPLSCCAEDSTKEAYSKSRTYHSVSSVLHQRGWFKTCDTSVNVPETTHAKSGTAYFSSTATSGKREKKRLFSDQLWNLKRQSTCLECKKKRYWSPDRLLDTPLNPCKIVTKSNVPQEKTFSSNRHSGSIVTLHLVSLSFKLDKIYNDTFSGSIFDDSTPYNGINLKEYKMLQTILLISWDSEFDTISAHFSNQAYWQLGTGNNPVRQERSSARPCWCYRPITKIVWMCAISSFLTHLNGPLASTLPVCVTLTTSMLTGWFWLPLKLTLQKIPCRS